MILEYEQPDGSVELWFCAISEKVMSMGTSPASQIASRFSEEWLEVFRGRMDAYVESVWMIRQSNYVRHKYKQRRTKLGKAQARPYWAGSFTDDVDILTVHPDLTAAGARIWDELCASANIWMCAMSKKQAGTVIQWIGPRYVVNGGYGYVGDVKRTRALVGCTAALNGTLERGEARSLNGQLAYFSHTCDWPVGSLCGITRPLQDAVGRDTELLVIVGASRDRYAEAKRLLLDRSSGSFWCAIIDLPQDISEEHAGECDAKSLFVMASSDAFRDPTAGAIFGHCNGMCWFFNLTGDWLRRPIALTETCGLYINKIEYGESHEGLEFISEVDATSALASAIGSATSAALQYARERAAVEPGVKAVETTSWIVHCEGKGNIPSDAGSRSKRNVLRAISRSFGLEYTERPLSQRSLDYMKDVLANTADCPPVNMPAHLLPATIEPQAVEESPEAFETPTIPSVSTRMEPPPSPPLSPPSLELARESSASARYCIPGLAEALTLFNDALAHTAEQLSGASHWMQSWWSKVVKVKHSIPCTPPCSPPSLTQSLSAPNPWGNELPLGSGANASLVVEQQMAQSRLANVVDPLPACDE